MKIETILNAMEDARYQVGFLFIQEDADNNWLITKVKRNRQYNAFRARILRMYAGKEKIIENMAVRLYTKDVKIMGKDTRIAEYRKEIIEKDEEIRVLEKYIEDHNYKTILDYMEKYLEGDIE